MDCMVIHPSWIVCLSFLSLVLYTPKNVAISFLYLCLAPLAISSANIVILPFPMLSIIVDVLYLDVDKYYLYSVLKYF